MTRRRTAVAAILSIFVVIACAGCDDLDGRTKNRQANRKFRETRFIDAAALYEDAITKVKDDKIEYNLGLAYSRIFRAGSTELVLLAEAGDKVCTAIPGNKPVKRSVCVKNDPDEEDRAYPSCGASQEECTQAYEHVARIRDEQVKNLEGRASNADYWKKMTDELSESYLDRKKILADHEKEAIQQSITELEKLGKNKACEPDEIKKRLEALRAERPAFETKLAAAKETKDTAKVEKAQAALAGHDTRIEAAATAPNEEERKKLVAGLKERLENDKKRVVDEKAKAKSAAEKKVAETQKAEQAVIAEIKKGGDAKKWLASQKDKLDACPASGNGATITCMKAMTELTEWSDAKYSACYGTDDCPSSATCKRNIDMCAIDNNSLANLSAKHLSTWIDTQPSDEEVRASVKTQQAEIEEKTKERDAVEKEAEGAKDSATGKFKDKGLYEKAMQKKTALDEVLKEKGNQLEESRLKFTMRALMTNLWIDSQQYDKAIGFWEGERKKRDKDFEAMGNLAGINLKSGNWRKAIEWYLTIAEQVPEDSNKVVAFSSVGNVAWSKLNSKSLTPEEAISLADLGLGALQKASELAPKNMGFYRLQIALYNFRAMTHGASWAAFIDRASSQDLKALSDVLRPKPPVTKKEDEPAPPEPEPCKPVVPGLFDAEKPEKKADEKKAGG